MFPSEGLYFRQEKKMNVNKCLAQPVPFKIVSCEHAECWQPVANNFNYCEVHQKMHSDESTLLFTKIFKHVSKGDIKKWKAFI